MRVAIIAPPSMVELTRYQGYHLLLPQELLREEAYGKFYKDVEGRKILDNGVAEAVTIPWNTLFDLGMEFDVDEIVVPDKMGNCDATIDLARKFEKHADTHPQFGYMGVVQGRNMKEVVKCLTFMAHQEWIDVVSFPRILANTIHRDIRSNMAEAFKEMIAQSFRGGIHFLGASNNTKEVLQLNGVPNARGIDTSMPVVMGLQGLNLRRDPYAPRQAYFFNEPKPPPMIEALIKENIRTMNEWAR